MARSAWSQNTGRARVNFSGSLSVDAPSDRVWELLRDPARLVSAIPGIESFEALDETTFSVRVAQRVGPFQARFDIRMSLTELDPPRRLVATGQGTGTGGSMLRIPSVVIDLEPTSSGGTSLSYNIEFSLLGKLGTLGYPVVKQRAGEMARLFGENLQRELEADS